MELKMNIHLVCNPSMEFWKSNWEETFSFSYYSLFSVLQLINFYTYTLTDVTVLILLQIWKYLIIKKIYILTGLHICYSSTVIFRFHICYSTTVVFKLHILGSLAMVVRFYTCYSPTLVLKCSSRWWFFVSWKNSWNVVEWDVKFC